MIVKRIKAGALEMPFEAFALCQSVALKSFDGWFSKALGREIEEEVTQLLWKTKTFTLELALHAHKLSRTQVLSIRVLS